MEPFAEKEIVNGCIKGDTLAQRQLYKLYAAKMLGVCKRYVKTIEEAEDILQEGFITVFTKLHQFKMKGSLEGWIRKIMVSRAIEHYRKAVRFFPMLDIEGVEEKLLSPEDVVSNISASELLQMIGDLPDTHRIVFNLYILENMSHKEIAEKINIPIGTSKSTLFHARMMLRRKINSSMQVAKKKQYDEKSL